MYWRGNQLGPSTSRYEDYRLAAAVGIILAAYAGFAFGLFWLMQPSVATNSGLAGYRPPPKTVVHSADSPWVVCHEYRRSKRRCATVREMKEGPSRSAIRC